MKRGFLAGGAAILVAAALAVPLWLAFDDGGARRAAALNPSSPVAVVGTGDVGQLTLAGVNGGNPVPVMSFSHSARRPAGAAQTDEVLRVTRHVDTNSPQLLGIGLRGAKAATAKLELLSTVALPPPRTVIATYNLTNVSIEKLDESEASLQAGEAVEALVLRYDTLTVSCAPSACREPVHEPGTEDQISISELGAEPVQIRAMSFGIEKGLGGAKVGFAPATVQMDLSNVAPALILRGRTGTSLGRVIVDLVKEGGAHPVIYATYDFTAAAATSVDLALSNPRDPPVLTVGLSFSRAKLSTTEILASGGTGERTNYCWNLETNSAC